MLPPISVLRANLKHVIVCKEEQGHVVTGLADELAALPASYDALAAFAERLATLPVRDDWPYVEPDDWAGIRAESAWAGDLVSVDLDASARRVEAAFLGSVCGCVLGKPLEINPTLDELEKAFTQIGEWPLRDYVSERVGPFLPRPFHGSWPETVRERIAYVAADDDINYTILGMVVLEQHGPRFTHANLRDAWLQQLPVSMTFGPERLTLLKAGINTLADGQPNDFTQWVTRFNPKDEFCGALIRADAYGYACPGRPALAAELAWRDASFTHRRTGIYGTMFVAAAIAAALVERDPLRVFETALRFVPQRSRFHKIVADSLTEVSRAKDWRDGYRRLHGKYWEYTHCRVFQEVGTLINTLRFAENVGDGIGKQVMQGNDTDSFGATAGSLLGAFFGPGHLEERWLAPFQDDIHTSLACFYERSLARLAQRMAQLPRMVAGQLAAPLQSAASTGRQRDATSGL